MIELRDVKTEYMQGKTFFFPAIRFEEGKITTVIGRNGSGKSTLLKTILGIRDYRGSIKIDGDESRGLSARIRARRVAYLPQTLKSVNIDVETLVSHGRYPWQGYSRRMSSKDHEIIDRALEITGMQDLKNRNLLGLSGGERQRAYLAMVVAQNTPMILLDEPAAYLDMAVQRAFYRILKGLAGDGHGIVLVSHNIEQSLSYSDSICLIHDDTVKAACTPDELVGNGSLLREVFGATFRRGADTDLLYPYVAVK